MVLRTPPGATKPCMAMPSWSIWPAELPPPNVLFGGAIVSDWRRW